MNKLQYVVVIQQAYAGYWEDASEYETDSQYRFKEKNERENFKSDLGNYRQMGYPTRTIKRRYPKPILNRVNP